MGSPKLRFKEFIGDLESIKLSDFSEIITSGSRDWAKYYANDGDKFIRMTNLVRDGIRLNLDDLKFVKLPESSTEGTRSSLQYGDILISITAELGKLGWIPKNFGSAYINQHIALVRLNNQINSKFVAYLLSTTEYNNKLNGLNDAGAKAGLNLPTIRQFKIKIPSKVEQTKIANFLTTVDEKISQLNEQYQLMIQYKKGVMQKIFSQEIRFKDDDGEEFGEWIDKTLSDVGEIITGKTPSTQNPDLWEGNILFITPTDLNNRKIQMKTERTVSGKGMKILPINTIVFTCIASIGKMAITGRASITNQQINSIIVKKDNFQFIYYALLNIVDFIKSTQSTTTMPIINKTEFSKFVIKVPCVREQTKIANFLSIIDDKIENLALQLEQVRNWKKGLLQQIFM